MLKPGSKINGETVAVIISVQMTYTVRLENGEETTQTRDAGMPTVIAVPGTYTKWDLISDAERASLDATSCGLTCGGCGTRLETEGDFARHFTVTDIRYRNLGECPVSVKAVTRRLETAGLNPVNYHCLGISRDLVAGTDWDAALVLNRWIA